MLRFWQRYHAIQLFPCRVPLVSATAFWYIPLSSLRQLLRGRLVLLGMLSRCRLCLYLSSLRLQFPKGYYGFPRVSFDFDYPLAISNKHVMRQNKQRALQSAGIRVMDEIFKMPRTGVVVDSYLLRPRRLDKGDGARGAVDVAETIIERDCAASEGILKSRSKTLREQGKT